MINRLYTRDFAILKELELEFRSGFTIITGETGAGKSILLQALSLALGAKGNKNMVKSGKTRTVVEVDVDGKSYRRILTDKGRIKSYIEDEPVKEIEFKTRTVHLADFHGQHEQQLIMNRDKHIDYLDRYCDLAEKAKKVADIFHSLLSTKNRLKIALETQESNKDRKELLEFQLREIDGVNPKDEEDIQLTNDFKILNHIDELVESIEKITQDFTESDHSIYNRLSAIVKELNKLGSYDKNLKNYLEGLNNVITTIQDTSISLSGYSNSLNPDKENLNNIEIRLQDIESLKRKYGGSLEAVKVYQNDMKHELENLINLETNTETLRDQIDDLEKQFQNLSDNLHEVRIVQAEKLSKQIEQEMHKLNMTSANFEIRINQRDEEDSFIYFNDKPVKINPNGYDWVEFYLSANPGEQLKPLTGIASGGEISRIMLAIKTVFQKNDPVETLIFDEIDSGISGTTAGMVAESLVKISRNRQVICITHLPQIASKANHHIHIDKTIMDSDTFITVQYLNQNERIDVINNLFSISALSDGDYQSLNLITKTAHG